MARLPTVPPPDLALKLKGKIQIVSDRGVIVAKKWPTRRPGKGTPAQARARQEFAEWVAALKHIDPIEIENAKIIARNSGYTWRDVISRASVGRMVLWEFVFGGAMPEFNVQAMLDQLGTEEGSIIVKAGGVWVLLPPGGPGQILSISDGEQLPEWIGLPDSGINQLTGDVAAGPGSGSQTATLANTAVTPGTYNFATVTVDSKGRLTAASTGTPPAYINELTGDAAAGPGSGSQILTLASTGVTPGSYTVTSLTVDAKGRITAASNGSASGTVQSGGGTIRLKSDVTPVGTPTGTAENDLQTYVLPANTLNANGQTIRIQASGTYVGNSTLKTIRLYFGSQVVSFGQNFANNTRWRLTIELWRVSPGNQLSTTLAEWWGSTAGNSYQNFRTALTEDETNNITIKTTGQNSVSGANNIVSEYLSIELLQAA